MLYSAIYYNYDGRALYLLEKLKTGKLNSKAACSISRFSLKGVVSKENVLVFSLDLLYEAGRDKKQLSCRSFLLKSSSISG